MVGDSNFSFLAEPPKPDLFYNDIPIDEDKEYIVLLNDVLNPKPSTFSNNSDYMVFRAMLTQGFDNLGINLQVKYKLHFPVKSFKIAWEQAPGYMDFKASRIYDCEMTFKKITQKKLRIIKRKFDEL